MVLIGITGKMGCGKDFIAKHYLVPFITKVAKSCFQLSFADQIKVNVMAKYNIPYDEVFIEKTNYTRTLLQHEGTENGRHTNGEDIWIKYFDSWMQVLEKKDVSNFITCDVRFKNEVDYIKSKGGIVIKVVANDRNHARLMNESKSDPHVMHRLKNHVSECDLDDLDDTIFDYVIDNSVGKALELNPLYTLLVQKFFSKSVHAE